MRKHLKTASYIANLLDNKFKVLGFRFGIDPLLGLIPGVGDAVSLALSLYIIWIGIKIELPKKMVFDMFMNTALDFLIGLVPVIGDIVDFTFKSNVINLGTIQEFMDKDAIKGEVAD